MNKLSISIALALSLFLPTVSMAEGMSCVDNQDTFPDYDNKVNERDIKDIPAGYYMTVYGWAPNHCAGVKKKNKQPGQKDYLQCGSNADFGYILHGLWPQGSMDNPRVFPRACEGDQPKIDRGILERYLCMTPSVWLLQHEYEYHGTCMHDESLETPEKYFGKAMELHSKFKLPDEELPNTKESVDWWLENNPSLMRESIKYNSGTKEWWFCYGLDFKPIACPGSQPTPSDTDTGCKVKGNISGSGKKYYFTASHPVYEDVVITPSKGEQCFATEQEARDAGWQPAP